MKTLSRAGMIGLALAAVAVQPAFAQRNFQVVREGDSEMACETMTAEINTLNQQVREQADWAQRNAQTRQAAGRMGRGLLSGLAQGAQMMGYGALGNSGNAVTNAVTSAAISGVASEIANSASQPSEAQSQPAAAPTESPQQQRLNHLMGIHGQRC